MKAKTINAIISKRMKQWWESIDDEALRERVRRETIVTGGCITSMLLNEKVTDYDVYFKTKETVRLVAEYYVKKFCEGRKESKKSPISIKDDGDRIRIVVKSAGVAAEDDHSLEYQYFESRPPEEAQTYVDEIYGGDADVQELYDELEDEALRQKDRFRPVFLSTNAITLSDKVQLIIRFWGKPDEIHENFDYVHCTNYWHKSEVHLKKRALESILTKELRYVGSRYPICSLMRMRKFIHRGWSITAGQILKMCMQVSELDLTKIEVLEDQLTGVDVAYFHEVITLMKQKDQEKVSTSYLLEILDRMF